MRQGKNWGYTTEFFRNAMVSTHHLEIKKDGYCSEHKHEHKFNVFYVISGKLEVIIYRENPKHTMMPDIEDMTVLTEGQTTAIPPGFWHRFRALEDTECIEVYQVLLVGEDIERRAEGGIKK